MPTPLSSWWQKILSRPRRDRSLRPVWPLRLESLEDRTLLSGDPLTLATPLTFQLNTAHASHFLSSPGEIDLYRIHLEAGDRVTASVNAQQAGSGLQGLLRIFDAGGSPVALDNQEGGNPQLTTPGQVPSLSRT
jgi:hypothetical protein